MVGSSSCAVITMIGTWVTARNIEISAQAVQVGQAEVEQHHLWRRGQHLLDPRQAGRSGRHGVPTLGEAAPAGIADRLVVLDHEDARHTPNASPTAVLLPRGCPGERMAS